jgi:O-antigen biosynthesis protein WbqP
LIKRIFDFLLAALLTMLFLPLMLLLALAVKLTSKGPIIFWSQRVGKNNNLFWMPKFRTMLIETPNVATHLLAGANQYLTPIGSFLRKSSLDELPQLWSVICGEMSFVGPRPALFNQTDLIDMRTAVGVHSLTPGITGWAQINGRDELGLAEKVGFDQEYLQNQDLVFDIQILWLTGLKVFKREGVSH